MSPRRLVRWLFLAVTLTVVAALAAFTLAAWREDATPLTRSEIREKADGINETAAVAVPHAFDGGAMRRTAPELFEKVERGVVLTKDESAAYRVAYQTIIFQKQRTLRRFDTNMQVLTDYGPDLPNNVGGHGISGSHDHHDESVRSNLAALTRELAHLDSSPPIARVYSAILAYKDLSDILAHLGTVPHTKSTPYVAPTRPLSDIERLGEDSMREFKVAQFAPVNSEPYWSAVFRGLDSFDMLVFAVQSTVNAKLNRLESQLAGRWGSWQSLGPWLGKGSTPRRRRQP